MDNIFGLVFVGLVFSGCAGMFYIAQQADKSIAERTYENMKYIEDYEILKGYCVGYDAAIRNHPKCHAVFK